MRRMDEQNVGTLPVFVFPNSIDIVFTQPHTHKQLITLYNPYDFPLSYRVLCTAPRKYSVIEPRGTLKSKCCVDIVIRHLSAQIRSNIGVSDRFRFEVCKYGDSEVSGRKDVAVRLVENASDLAKQASIDRGNFHANFQSESSSGFSPPQYAFPSSPGASMSHSTHWLAIVAALVCIGALMLPIQGDTVPSLLPPYLHLSVPQKLVAAYVLGIVTMLIIRPT